MLHSNHGPSRTVFGIDSDFSRKSQISPVYLMPPLKGFPLELDIGARDQKTIIMGLPDGYESFKIWFSHLDTIPACDRQMDGQTDIF